MRFVEIEDMIINLDAINLIQKSKIESDNIRIDFNIFNSSGYDGAGTRKFSIYVDSCYYEKLKDLLHPIKLTNDKEYINVNDFPGDNMIEE